MWSTSSALEANGVSAEALVVGPQVKRGLPEWQRKAVDVAKQGS